MLCADTWAGKELPRECMASLTPHFCVQRGDSRSHVVDTCRLPRAHGGSSASEMLQLVSDYLDVVTEAAGGLPPLSLAYDGATLNNLVNAAFAGIMHPDDLADLPWFKFCQAHSCMVVYFCVMLCSEPCLDLGCLTVSEHV